MLGKPAPRGGHVPRSEGLQTCRTCHGAPGSARPASGALTRRNGPTARRRVRSVRHPARTISRPWSLAPSGTAGGQVVGASVENVRHWRRSVGAPQQPGGRRGETGRACKPIIFLRGRLLALVEAGQLNLRLSRQPADFIGLNIRCALRMLQHGLPRIGDCTLGPACIRLEGYRGIPVVHYRGTQPGRSPADSARPAKERRSGLGPGRWRMPAALQAPWNRRWVGVSQSRASRLNTTAAATQARSVAQPALAAFLRAPRIARGLADGAQKVS